MTQAKFDFMPTDKATRHGTEGERLRDQALLAVAEKSGVFMDEALAFLSRLNTGAYTGEDIRKQIEAAGIHPHHHNAWGAVIATAVRSHLLYPTGKYVSMKDPRSHARKTQVYAKTTNESCG